MANSVSAVALAALGKLARGKTRKVAQKLQVAEQELHTANTELMDALPPKVKDQVTNALEKSQSAEDKVREATDELEVVTELLTQQQDEEARQATAGDAATALQPPGGKSGHGAQSVMKHIKEQARGKPG